MQKVKELASARSCTAAQLALAWVLAQWQYIVPIPGTRHIKSLDENLGAARVHLSADDLAAINAVFPVDVAAGERYPQEMMRLVRG